MSRISCPRQGPFKDQDEAVSKARLRKHQPVMRQSVRQTHRLSDKLIVVFYAALP